MLTKWRTRALQRFGLDPPRGGCSGGTRWRTRHPDPFGVGPLDGDCSAGKSPDRPGFVRLYFA